MSFQRRAYDMDLGRRDHTRWLGSSGRYSTRLTLPTANLLAAWDARAGVTNVSGECSAWADQSGNGFHATQGTAISRPTITTADGYASLLFDGTNDSLNIASLTAGSGTKTFYAVIKPVAPASYDAIFQSASPMIFVGMFGSNFIAFDSANRDSGLAHGSARCRIAYEIQSGAFTAWKNGTASTPTTWSGSNLAIGGAVSISNGGNPLGAHLLFLAIYTAARNTAVESYITQEWGV